LTDAGLVAGYVATGLSSGFLGGLLGIGGGIVIVPALILVFDATGIVPAEHSTAIAVATSLACIVFTSLSAALAQLRARMVEWIVVRRWLVPVCIGSLFAGWLGPQLPTSAFRAFIGLFLGAVSVVMLTNWKPAPHRRFPAPAPAAASGLLAGLIAGIAGIGGGNVMVPVQVFFNVPVHRATATSSALGVAIAASGAAGYIGFAGSRLAATPAMAGFVYVPAFIAIVIAAVIAAPVGVRVAHRVDARMLRRLFGILLIVVAVRMLWTA
jgi:uncharacterized membrane protein YfcA